MKSNPSEGPSSSPPEWAAEEASKIQAELCKRVVGEYSLTTEAWGLAEEPVKRYIARLLVKVRRDALEEAAKRCEQVTDNYTLLETRLAGMRADIVSEECALEIRALIKQEPKR